jgi:hypothetical protein
LGCGLSGHWTIPPNASCVRCAACARDTCCNATSRNK